jgi:hypothetical protein
MNGKNGGVTMKKSAPLCFRENVAPSTTIDGLEIIVLKLRPLVHSQRSENLCAVRQSPMSIPKLIDLLRRELTFRADDPSLTGRSLVFSLPWTMLAGSEIMFCEREKNGRYKRSNPQDIVR